MDHATLSIDFDVAIEEAQTRLKESRASAKALFVESARQAVEEMDLATDVYDEAVEAYSTATRRYAAVKQSITVLWQTTDEAAIEQYDFEIAEARKVYRAGLRFLTCAHLR